MEFCPFSDEEGSVRCQRIGRRSNAGTFAPVGAMYSFLSKNVFILCVMLLLLQRFEISSNIFLQPHIFLSVYQ
jgi:hypothetical protein